MGSKKNIWPIPDGPKVVKVKLPTNILLGFYAHSYFICNLDINF